MPETKCEQRIAQEAENSTACTIYGFEDDNDSVSGDDDDDSGDDDRKLAVNLLSCKIEGKKDKCKIS